MKSVIIKDTHRGLLYEDGVFKKTLGSGRYTIKPERILFWRRPKTEIVLVDVRERDLTIKGQEILTADKVALRVSIVVQFRVTDPTAAIHNVANYEERIYSDVQLAARRSLASMALEEIMTNRNKLSDEILAEVKESAAGYGVAILRAAVKDLIFPGDLQQIMNRVLAAERQTQADLIQAKAKADRDRLEAETRAEVRRVETEATAQARRQLAQSDAEATRIRMKAEAEGVQAQQQTAAVYDEHPSMLRLRELEAMADLAKNANARIYIGFDKHYPNGEGGAADA